MDWHFWVPIVMATGGAVISFLTTMLIGLVAWILKHELSRLERRLDSAEITVRLHESYVSAAKTQTEHDKGTLSELKTSIAELHRQIDDLRTLIIEGQK